MQWLGYSAGCPLLNCLWCQQLCKVARQVPPNMQRNIRQGARNIEHHMTYHSYFCKEGIKVFIWKSFSRIFLRYATPFGRPPPGASIVQLLCSLRLNLIAESLKIVQFTLHINISTCFRRGASHWHGKSVGARFCSLSLCVASIVKHTAAQWLHTSPRLNTGQSIMCMMYCIANQMVCVYAGLD